METHRYDPSEDSPFGKIEMLPFGNVAGSHRCSICGQTAKEGMLELVLWTNRLTCHKLILCRDGGNCAILGIQKLERFGGHFHHEEISTTPITDGYNLPSANTDALIDLPYPEDGLFMKLKNMFSDPNGREMINSALHCCNEKRKREGETVKLYRFTAKTKSRFLLEIAGFYAVIHAVEAITITRGNKEGHHRRATEIGFFAALKALANWELQKDEETIALMFASNAYNTSRLLTFGLENTQDSKFLFSTVGKDSYQRLQRWVMDWANVLWKRIEHLGLNPSKEKPHRKSRTN